MAGKCLCVFALDASGSMLESFDETKESKISKLNRVLENFISKIKDNPKFKNRLEVCMIEIKEKAEVLIPPIDIRNASFPKLDTTVYTHESIGAGISLAVKQIKKWKQRDFWNELLKQNYTPFLILITDLPESLLKDQEENYPFSKKIYSLAEKNYLKFHALGIGDANLTSLFDKSNKNLIISNHLDFDSFLDNLESELALDLTQNRPFKDEAKLIFKYSSLTKSFLKKHFLKKILPFAVAITILDYGCTFFEFNAINVTIEKLIEINNIRVNEYNSDYSEKEVEIELKKEKRWVPFWFDKNTLYYTSVMSG